MGLDYIMDFSRWGISFKKLDCVIEELRKFDSVFDYEDDMSDRVYIIDFIYFGVLYNNFLEFKVSVKFCDEYVFIFRGLVNYVDLGDFDVKKLYLRF